jgi:hypothetical protein
LWFGHQQLYQNALGLYYLLPKVAT